MSEFKTELEELNKKVESLLCSCLLTEEGKWKHFESVEVYQAFLFRILEYVNEETKKIIKEFDLGDEYCLEKRPTK